MLIPVLIPILLHRQEPPGAAALVSKMFARYAAAKSLSGTIKTTQSAGPAMVATETEIAYERPSKLRIVQSQRGQEIRRQGAIISDGNNFTYRPPNRILAGAPWLIEPVQPQGRAAQTIADIYTVVAADLPDRSPALDAMIARTDDLKYFANQLATLQMGGRASVGGREANVITGDWRETNLANKGDAPRHLGDPNFIRDTYKLYITDAGDLVRYELVQHFAAPAAIGRRGAQESAQVTVTTVWDANVVVDAAIPSGTFALKAP